MEVTQEQVNKVIELIRSLNLDTAKDFPIEVLVKLNEELEDEHAVIIAVTILALGLV